MCGIAGFLLREQAAERATIELMCGQMVHRGPDDEGFHVERTCAIGMRRLSIIDLATGSQPISNEDGTVWVVFNGEIYNFQSLRRELIAGGHKFRTNSDTETLVHLYEEHGEAALEHLRGMFAFAIWDAARDRILLARDRFGKKPLYYAVRPDGLYFASEMNCLTAIGLPTDIDRQSLRLYFQFRYIPDPYTAFESVRRLPAGSWLTFHRGGRLRQGRYWQPPRAKAQAAPTGSEPELTHRLRETFDEAVRLRMIADVPLGAFLSGGIDSSSVVASMALQSPDPVSTFSIGFEESAFNELPYARLVAQKFNTDHHEIVVKPDAVSLVEKIVRHFGEPFADSSAIPTFIVSEFAAQHVKVTLTGDGGDELFAGYDTFRSVRKHRILDRVPRPFRRVLSLVADGLPYSARGKNFLRMISRPNAIERYFEFNYSPYFLRRRLLEPEWMLSTDDDTSRRIFPDCLLPDEEDIVAQVLFFEATANLTGDMLVKVDRMSMANSLEVRCPMLDHQLAHLASAIPYSWNLGRNRGKDFFIRTMGDRLPEQLLNRPKTGFGVPLSLWFRGELRDFLQDHLTSAKFVNRRIASPAFVRYLIDEHDSGRRDNSHNLWTLLVLEVWFRELEKHSAVGC